jgi:mRNA interferase RelE/StbE
LRHQTFRLGVDIALRDIKRHGADRIYGDGNAPMGSSCRRRFRERVGKKLDAFAATGHGDIKRLKGQTGSRLGVGDWRLIFYEESGMILVVGIGHRREIYD